MIKLTAHRDGTFTLSNLNADDLRIISRGLSGIAADMAVIAEGRHDRCVWYGVIDEDTKRWARDDGNAAWQTMCGLDALVTPNGKGRSGTLPSTSNLYPHHNDGQAEAS